MNVWWWSQTLPKLCTIQFLRQLIKCGGVIFSIFIFIKQLLLSLVHQLPKPIADRRTVE